MEALEIQQQFFGLMRSIIINFVRRKEFFRIYRK